MVPCEEDCWKSILPKVEETEAVVKGQTAASSYKPATLDNGLNIYVSYYDKKIPHGIDTQEDLINARKHIKDVIKRES